VNGQLVSFEHTLSLLLDSETDLYGLEGCLNHGVITKTLRRISRVAFCA
jgi:hypothetical protein